MYSRHQYLGNLICIDPRNNLTLGKRYEAYYCYSGDSGDEYVNVSADDGIIHTYFIQRFDLTSDIPKEKIKKNVDIFKHHKRR